MVSVWPSTVIGNGAGASTCATASSAATASGPRAESHGANNRLALISTDTPNAPSV